MKKIDININQAKLLSYSVTLGDDSPEVTATVGLYAGNKKISSFSLTTQSYYEGIKFDLSPDIVFPIVDIAKKLEAITVAQCKKALMELPEPEEC